MAVMRLLTSDNSTDLKTLRAKSRNVKIGEFNTNRLSALLVNMLDTVRHNGGVGIAAPQVGVLKRICLIMDFEANERKGIENIQDALYYELINPVIIEQSGDIEDVEGCLSVPGRCGLVKRPEYIKLRAFDKYGSAFTLEAHGASARVISHEIDHLNGKLYTDKVIRYVTEEEYRLSKG